MTESNHRFGVVGILGRPNVGKSTLLNRLLGQKLAIATPKPQTTRDRIKGIRTFEDWQVVWVDTPGIHEAETKLNRYMVELAIATVSEVDLAYLLVDASKAVSNFDKTMEETKRIVTHLERANKTAFLVLNKVDKLADKGVLFSVIERFAPLYPFAEVVPVSAKSGSNVDALLKATREKLPVGGRLYEEDELTDRPVRYLAKEIVREQLFLMLGQELPYSTAVDVLAWEEKGDGLVVIHANIVVARKSHKPIVVGKGADMVRKVGERSRERIEKLIERKVFLDLRVKVDEGWTERDDKLKELGYNELD